MSRTDRSNGKNPYSIDLDCPPGCPRPYDLIEDVLEGTGLTEKDFATGNPFFGNQTWMLKGHEKDSLYEKARPVIKARVINLYEAGIIRYGSW